MLAFFRPWMVPNGIKITGFTGCAAARADTVSSTALKSYKSACPVQRAPSVIKMSVLPVSHAPQDISRKLLEAGDVLHARRTRSTLKLKCRSGAVTRGSGTQTEAECYCDDAQYKSSVTPLACTSCPYGAQCQNGGCAFHWQNRSCPEGDPVGLWMQAPSGLMVISQCPEGYALVNSTDGTAYGTFSHDAQQCKPCLTDTQYILRPRDSCQPCPPGLRCYGNSSVDPMLDGSQWEIEGPVYRLRSCPTGYSVHNVTVEQQECQ
eukprot:2573114-Rhodomonas_salina.1